MALSSDAKRRGRPLGAKVSLLRFPNQELSARSSLNCFSRSLLTHAHSLTNPTTDIHYHSFRPTLISNASTDPGNTYLDTRLIPLAQHTHDGKHRIASCWPLIRGQQRPIASRQGTANGDNQTQPYNRCTAVRRLVCSGKLTVPDSG